MKNECELKKFKVCTVYPRIRSFSIYTIVSFFKTLSTLPVCVKILSILKKKKKKKLVQPLDIEFFSDIKDITRFILYVNLKN